MNTERLWRWAGNALIAVLFATPFVGFGMALYTDNGYWFWLCGIIVFFLS